MDYKLYKCKSQAHAQTQLDNLGDTEKLTAEVLVFKSNADFYQRQGLLTAERVEKLLQENQQLGSTVTKLQASDQAAKKQRTTTDPAKHTKLLAAVETERLTEHATAKVVTPSKPKKNPYGGNDPYSDSFSGWQTSESVSRSSGDDNSPHTGSSKLESKMDQDYAVEGMTLNIYWFNNTPKGAQGSVIMYDFVDSVKHNVHWCHRPHIWRDIFVTDNSFPPEDRTLSTFFHLNRSCQQRKQKQGLNIPKKIKVKGSKSDRIKVRLSC